MKGWRTDTRSLNFESRNGIWQAPVLWLGFQPIRGPPTSQEASMWMCPWQWIMDPKVDPSHRWNLSSRGEARVRTSLYRFVCVTWTSSLGFGCWSGLYICHWLSSLKDNISNIKLCLILRIHHDAWYNWHSFQRVPIAEVQFPDPRIQVRLSPDHIIQCLVQNGRVT